MPRAVAHCVRQQHSSMAQTSRIYLPTARYFIAERELYRDTWIPTRIPRRKNPARDERYAELWCTSRTKSIARVIAENLRARSFFFPPSLQHSSHARFFSRRRDAYLWSRKVLKVNATDVEAGLEDESAAASRRAHACEKVRLNEFISSYELQRRADNKYHAHLFIAAETAPLSRSHCE